ncbi:MAG: acetyl-CoA C-acyltransferase, partial [Acidobacteriaceae bacterium]
MREAVIVSAVRTAVGKAPRGALRNTRPDELGAAAVRGALERVPQLDAREIDDVILGCAMPEAEQGMNLARIVSLRAELPVETGAMTINRFCASGLQAIALAAERIRGGGADAIVAGGAESMSMVPMGGNKIAVNPWLVEHRPGAYLTMGLTAERVARKYGVSREDADRFSLESHQKAVAAIEKGNFIDEIVPVSVTLTVPDGKGKPRTNTTDFRVDEGPRAETTLEALAKLPPVFHAKGVVTAGNASQTSDGAAAAVVMASERAQALGIR